MYVTDYEQLSPGMYKCTICANSIPIPTKRVKQHDNSVGHQRAVRRAERSQHGTAGPSRLAPASSNFVHGPLVQMLDDMIRSPHQAEDNEWIDTQAGVAIGVDWDALEEPNFELTPSVNTQTMSKMAEKARQYILDPEGQNEDSDNEIDERPESDHDSDALDTGNIDSECEYFVIMFIFMFEDLYLTSPSYYGSL